MASKTKLEIKSFIKGLITEASPLTFPDNASIVDQNFVLNKDGSRQRRLGLAFYKNMLPVSSPNSVSGPAIGAYTWENPLQEGSFDIIVVQMGRRLYFYNSSLENGLDTDRLNGGLPYTLPISMSETQAISGDSLRGQFILSYGGKQVIVLDYDEDSDTISDTFVSIKIRDVFGIDDGYSVDERPTIVPPLATVTDQQAHHVYNLRNQGWPVEVKAVQNPEGSSVTEFDPIILPLHDPTEPNDWAFPSNADVYVYGKAENAEIPDAIGAYSPYTLRKQVFGNTPAPKGKFVIDLFDRSSDRQTYYDANLGEVPSGNTLRTDISDGYVSQVAAYAGRVFFSVVETALDGGDENSPRLSSTIYFSQVVNSEKQIGAAHSEADPTSEHIFDVVATDGGFVQIPEAGRVLKLAPLGESLFVLCTNGVWEIHGGEQAFSATNINLAKTTTVGTISTSSVVVSETVLTYWATNGIYLISIDPASLRGTSTSISINTIQSLYDDIPLVFRQAATGTYDAVNRRIRWLYPDAGQLSIAGFLRELVFDVDLRAFYVNTFPDDLTYCVRSMVAVPELLYVVADRDTTSSVSFRFAYFNDLSFADFGLYDAKATLVTGYLTGGAGSIDKKVISLVTHFKRTEYAVATVDDVTDFVGKSGCIITPMWEWTDSTAAGKWGVPFQAYRLPRPYFPTTGSETIDYGYTVVTSKHGVRGRGRALSLKFESEPEKDLHIYGWGLELEVDDKF